MRSKASEIMTRKYVSISSNGKNIQKKKTRGNQWSILWNARKPSENQNIHWKRRKQSSETLALGNHRPGNRYTITNQDKIESFSINIIKLCFEPRNIKNDLLQIFIIILQLIYQIEDLLVCTRLRLLQNIIVAVKNDLQLDKPTKKTIPLTFSIFYLYFCHLSSTVKWRSEYHGTKTSPLNVSCTF